MKNKLYNILTKPYVVVLMMFAAVLLTYFERNLSYFFSLGIVLLILWLSNFNWSLFGFSKRITRKTIVQALFITALLIIVNTFTYTLIEDLFGKTDYSSFEGIKHNTINFIIVLIISWVLGAFGEELVFRGYFMNWLAKLFGDTNKSWLVSGIITSLYFALSHFHQGVSGVLGIAISALIISYIFYKNKQNLGLLMLIHGFKNTWGLTFLYLDIEDPIVHFFEQLLLN